MAHSTTYLIFSADDQHFTRAQVMSMMLVADGIDTIKDTVFGAEVGRVYATNFRPDLLIRTLRNTKRITADEDKCMCERLLTTFGRIENCSNIDIRVVEDVLFLWRKLVKSLAYRDETYGTLVVHTPNDEITKPPFRPKLHSRATMVSPATVHSRYSSANTLAFLKKMAEEKVQPANVGAESEELANAIIPKPEPYNKKRGTSHSVVHPKFVPNKHMKDDSGDEQDEEGWTLVDEPRLDDGDWNIVTPSTMLGAGEARVWAMQ